MFLLPGVGLCQGRVLYASEVTRLPLGCRVAAMGDAGVALPQHGPGAYHNPAVPALLSGYEVWVEGARLYGGLSNQGALALMAPLQEALYVSALYAPFFSGHIIEYDTLPSTYLERLSNDQLRADGSQNNGYFHNNQHVVIASLARRFALPVPRPPGMSVPLPVDLAGGLNVKYVWQTLTPGDKVRLGMNVNLDMGLLLRVGVDYDLETEKIVRQVCVGAAVRNIVPTEMVWVNSPQNYREPVDNSQYYGLAYVDDVGLGPVTWRASLALHRRLDGIAEERADGTVKYKTFFENSYHYGAEVGLWDVVDLRAGLSDRVPTLGAGVHYGTDAMMFHVDYAFRFDRISTSPLRLALGVEFEPGFVARRTGRN